MRFLPWETCAWHEAVTGVTGVSDSNQGHGIHINGRQINDINDNDDQEVNDTNTDPVCPSPTNGMLAEGVSRR